MKSLKSVLLLSFVNLIALFCVTLTLPDIIPIHFNHKMQADGYGSRWFTVILGAIPFIISLGVLIYWTLNKNNTKSLRNRKGNAE